MKYTILSLNIILIVVFNVNNLYSQPNFKTGYVIDNHKDTIRGFIDYRNWNITPEEIVFKSVSDSTVTIYTPGNVQGFNVEGERYLSEIVTIDESPFRDNELSESAMPQNRTDSVFLQILIDGPLSLYYLKDRNARVHFFIGKNGICETLFRHSYFSYAGGAKQIKTDEKYKGQLVVYFQDCPSIQKKIYSVTYSKKDLINLFKEYYEYTQNKILYQSGSEKIKSEFGFFAGLCQANLKFIGSDDFKSIINAGYPSSSNITFGGFYNIILPRTKSRWSINNELMFESYKVKGFFMEYFQDLNIYTESYSSIGCSYIALNNFLKYKHPVNKMFLFIEGGISNGIAISKTNYMKEVEHIYSATNTHEYLALANPRKIETGYILGLGSNFRNFSCELRIEKSNGMSTYMRLASPVLRYYLILGYKF